MIQPYHKMKKVFSSSIYVVSETDGSVLLVRHDLLKMWIPPGGHAEENETPLETALRELEEETRIRRENVFLPLVKNNTVRGFLAYEEHGGNEIGRYFMNHVFIGTVPHAVPIRGDNEYSAYAWVRKVPTAPWAVDTTQKIVRTPSDVANILTRISSAWHRGALKPPFETPGAEI